MSAPSDSSACTMSALPLLAAVPSNVYPQSSRWSMPTPRARKSIGSTRAGHSALRSQNLSRSTRCRVAAAWEFSKTKARYDATSMLRPLRHEPRTLMTSPRFIPRKHTSRTLSSNSSTSGRFPSSTGSVLHTKPILQFYFILSADPPACSRSACTRGNYKRVPSQVTIRERGWKFARALCCGRVVTLGRPVLAHNSTCASIHLRSRVKIGPVKTDRKKNTVSSPAAGLDAQAIVRRPSMRRQL